MAPMTKDVRNLLLLLGSWAGAIGFLPKSPLDPWGFIYPRKVAFIFLSLISVHFLSALTMHFFGRRLGKILANFLGGLVSSTAVSVAIAKSATEKNISESVVGISAACFAMLLEAEFIVWIGAPELFWKLLPALLAAKILNFLQLHLFFRRNAGEAKDSSSGLSVDFNWLEALRLTGILCAMFAIVAAAKALLGEGSVRLVTFLGSFFEMHGIVFANVNMAESMREASLDGRILFLLSLTGALFSKAAIAGIFGSRRLFFQLGWHLGSTLVLAWAISFLA